MARGPGTYSRAIAWLKIALPLTTLGLLATIFLYARPSDPTANLPVQTLEALSDRTSEQATRARFSGTTEDGALLTMAADTARPDPERGDLIRAERFAAQLTFDDGSTIDLDSPDAALETEAERARLTGGVTVRSSTGYDIRTDSLTARLDTIDVESDGTVTATGPAGDLTAGKMRITALATDAADPAGTEGDVLLRFTDGVQMIYRPQSEEGAPE